jgi:uracil-DNA glycosylase family 4
VALTSNRRRTTGQAIEVPRADDRDQWAALRAEIEGCRACPRLVAWREQVARTRRAAYRDQPYWGRPVPGFGDPRARVVLVGLAPAAHGGNRTGRIFTGDRSGDWLFAALWRAGFANQPTSVARDDGLVLTDAYVTAAVRCAPPQNRPDAAERERCRPYLVRELRLLRRRRVVVALGGLAWAAVWAASEEAGVARTPRPRPRFAHGAEVPAGPVTVLGCYHPSQQNTFTGRLTPAMLDAVLARARALVEAPAAGAISGAATPSPRPRRPRRSR